MSFFLRIARYKLNSQFRVIKSELCDMQNIYKMHLENRVKHNRATEYSYFHAWNDIIKYLPAAKPWKHMKIEEANENQSKSVKCSLK